MLVLDIVRAAIPDADQRLAEHIVWCRTPYPFTKPGARGFYKAASGFRRASAKGVTLCDHCERPANANGYQCQLCYDALHSARSQGERPATKDQVEK